jgi:hypothetical protein
VNTATVKAITPNEADINKPYLFGFKENPFSLITEYKIKALIT